LSYTDIFSIHIIHPQLKIVNGDADIYNKEILLCET